MRSSIAVIFVHLVLAGAIGCDRGARREVEQNIRKAQEAAEVISRIDAFVYDAPVFFGQGDLARLRALPTFKSESVEFVDAPNAEGEKLECRTFLFDGLKVYGVVSEGKLQPISIEISAPRWKVLHDLNVGSDASRVPGALGQPPRVMKGPVEEFSGETETVRFFISKGKIERIELAYYFD